MAILATQYPTFQRAMRIITNITNAQRAVVTTSFPHQYLTGLIVRIIIPVGYGMQELNQKQGIITVLSDTTFSVDIDTRYIDAYSVPSSYPQDRQYPQVIPIGEDNALLNNATYNALPYTS